MVDGLFGTETEVTALHVRDEKSIPAFQDQPVHAHEAWERAFRRRTGARHDRVPLRLDTGSASDLIISTALDIPVDMIALDWGQDLSPGRSRVVRDILLRSTLPVLLLPTRASIDPR